MGKDRNWLIIWLWVCGLVAAAVVNCIRASIIANTVYDVYTAADLAGMADSSSTFYLRNDLDLTDFGDWVPIRFSGTFDGQGHTIRGIKITEYAGKQVGFFSIMGGTVQNLHIDVDIQESVNDDGRIRWMDIGGLAGTLSGTVSGVSVSGQVQAAGNMESGKPLSIHIGGLAGNSRGDVRIFNCFSKADVTLAFTGEENHSYHCCGGLAGAASPIINCYASGNVVLSGVDLYADAKDIYCDGLVGDAYDVQHSYFCNFHDPQWNARNTYSAVENHGIYRTREEMRQQSMYVDWDFSTVWDISPAVNDGFPFLRPNVS